VLSSGEASGWFLAKDLRIEKKGHARGIYFIFLIADAATRNFWHFGAPSSASLYVLLSTRQPVPFIGCACSLTSSFDPVVLPI
jgi:hypothetical protein